MLESTILQSLHGPYSKFTLLATDLGDGDPTLPGQFFLGLLTGVRIAQVRVEILIQYLCRLLTEIPSLPPVKYIGIKYSLLYQLLVVTPVTFSLPMSLAGKVSQL